MSVGLLALAISNVYGACGIDKGSVRILGNDFPAIHAIADEASKCKSAKVKITKNLTKEHKDLHVASLTSNPAQYTTVVVANGTLTPLLNNNLVRPLDDLVAKYGKKLSKSQLITVDGKIMAVAFMANAQHLFIREDILKKAGLSVPTTYEEVVKAAKIIQDKGLMKYPLSGTYKAGWNLAEEFVNMYMGYGGQLFKQGSAEPSVNNKKGIATLEMMKKLTKYMNPDYLTFDSNAVQADWEAGKVAIVNLWGSRYKGIMDNEGSTKDIVSNTKIAKTPSVGGLNIPATTLWWDGFTIAKNISKTDAEATFQAMMNGISSKMANANAQAAVWIIKGHTTGANGKAIVDTASSGAVSYPMLPYMGSMHGALGSEIVDFFQGKESASKALSDVEAAYRAKAKESGFL